MNKNIEDHVVAGLREIYQSDEATKAFFGWAANRTNDATETSLERVMQMARMSRQGAVEFARQLAELGCGDFIVGRKGWKSRIQWKYSLRSIGEAAQGRAANLKDIDPEIAEDAVDQHQPPVIAESVSDRLFTIADAKRALAATFGVSPESIDITIRG